MNLYDVPHSHLWAARGTIYVTHPAVPYDAAG
jgi:hypothetical protein